MKPTIFGQTAEWISIPTVSDIRGVWGRRWGEESTMSTGCGRYSTNDAVTWSTKLIWLNTFQIAYRFFWRIWIDHSLLWKKKLPSRTGLLSCGGLWNKNINELIVGEPKTISHIHYKSLYIRTVMRMKVTEHSGNNFDVWTSNYVQYFEA